MDVVFLVLLVFGGFVLPGIFAGLIAQSKGYDLVAFMLLGVFSLLGTLFALIILPDISDRELVDETHPSDG